jgi:thiol-disulfide isomerase/thioredoxin
MKTLRLALAIFALLASHLVANGASTIELRPFVRGSRGDILKAHAGEPTIVHFWGVTCGPCRTELPHWAKLLRERTDFKFVVINADLVPDAPDAICAMLDQTGLAGAENWMFVDGFVERLRYEIDRQWRGEIPRTMLIGREGAVTTIEGAADMDVVKVWLDEQTAAAR